MGKARIADMPIGPVDVHVEGRPRVLSLVRRNGRTLVVATVVSGVTAAVLAGSPAGAHLGRFGHLKAHFKALFLSNQLAYVASAPVTLAPAAFGSATAVCPPGQSAVGGGSSTDYSGDDAELEASYPSSTATVPAEPPGTVVNALGTNAWTVSVENFGADPLNFKAVAVCVQGIVSAAISGTPYRPAKSASGATR